MSKTREERRRDRRLRRVCHGVILVALAAVVLAVILGAVGCDPAAEEPKTARERAAEFAAQERYYELLDWGMSEWSAREAARLTMEGGDGDGRCGD